MPDRTRPFETLMAVEGRWTGDDRLIMVDALSWDGLLPFILTMNHDSDVAARVGEVAEIERVPGANEGERFIIGRGVLDLGSPAGVEVERQLDAGFALGVSVEIDAIDLGGVDPDTVDDGDDPFWMMVVESARIRALSVVTSAAFAEAHITLGEVDPDGVTVPALDGPTPIPADEVPSEPGMPDEGGARVIVASGHTITIPDLPPAEWFQEPTDVEITGALTVTDEGRVYGMLAPANVLHRNASYDGVTVPMGNVDYAAFLRGETPCADSSRVVTGNVTHRCGHSLSAARGIAVEHYDNSCSVVATVAVGERHSEPRGVWVAGALMPGVSGEDVRRMMACQLSGHWNPTPRGYELLAALLVPVPGFPMPRSRASVTVRDGALVASAVPVQFAEPECTCGDVYHRAAAAVAGSRVAQSGLVLDPDIIERLERIERRLAVLNPDIRASLVARVPEPSKSNLSEQFVQALLERKRRARDAHPSGNGTK